MHRFSTRLLGLGVLTWLGCGAPAELDEDIFPALGATGYTVTAAGAASTGGPINTPAANGGASNVAVANGGAPSVPAGGRGGGSSVAPPSGAAGAAGAASAVGMGAGGSPPTGGGAGQTGSPPAVGGSGQASGGCPDDITVLFNRPATDGGCDGNGCHRPGGTGPDLVSPNPEARLLDVQSKCMGRPYIGADDSFLVDKISGAPPQCGLAMPFLTPQSLSAADEQCIIQWVEEVSGG